jgi:hypothetical protein
MDKLENAINYADKERLDWLENQEGCGLISDDCGHWAVSGDGFQNIPVNQRKNPEDIQTAFFIESKQWKVSIRDAIDAAISTEKKYWKKR